MKIDVSKIEKILKKLKKKDIILFKALKKKIIQIAEMNIESVMHFKNLKYDLSDSKRVHIKKCFVLTFKIEGDTVVFKNFGHHDDVYRR